ncbi:hypothetical protein ILUMI_06116 [Ignelater luminosus]|uniref:Transposase n=1 Tax=Ignelater luminosus TaxID=2038154 RepID=A0A8K0DG96_IGNLU|nr:hypothetical protein ILUMI_06116 [Ignelater luminosus]
MESERDFEKQRIGIKFLVNELEMMNPVYGEHLVKRSLFFKWVGRFREERSSTEEDEQSGRPGDAVSKTFARHLQLGTLKNRPRQSRFLSQIARRSAAISHPEFQRQLFEATGVRVSPETVRKRLRAQN